MQYLVEKKKLNVLHLLQYDFDIRKFYRWWRWWEVWCRSIFLNGRGLSERRRRECLLILRNKLWWLLGLVLLRCVKLRGRIECLLIWLEIKGIWRRWLLWNRGFYWLVIVRNCVCNEWCICVLFGLFARCSKWIDWIDFWAFQCFTSFLIESIAIVWSVLSIVECLSEDICVECASSQKIGWPWIGVVWITAKFKLVG